MTTENYYIGKWVNNEISDAELIAIVGKEEFEYYRIILKKTEHLKIESTIQNDAAVLQNILKSKENNVISIAGKAPNYGLYMKVAALLALISGLVFFFLNTKSTFEATTLLAENKTILLPDASNVKLNYNSKLSYDEKNWDEERVLELNGEAFFKVSKGKKFTVNTANGSVSVLGTQFNVKSRAQNFVVTCYEGSVAVVAKNKKVQLKKGESVVLKNNELLENKVATMAPLWQEGTMEFNNESLDVVLDELSVNYAVTFKKEGTISSERFTGILPLNDKAKCLKILEKTYQLKIKNKDNVITLYE